MKFRMFLKPIDYDAEDLEEANDICSEVLMESQLEVTLIEKLRKTWDGGKDGTGRQRGHRIFI